MNDQETVFLNSVFFVLGFTLIFSILGILFQTALSSAAFAVMEDLRVVGGVIIVIFGMLLILSAKYAIPFFISEHRIQARRFNNGFIFSFTFGIAFAIGWTPCVGAILGSIYVLAATSPGMSFLLLLSYSLGMGIPFLIIGAFASRLTSFIRRIQGFLKYFNIISGLFLVSVGLLVATGYIGLLSVFLVGSGGVISMEGQLNFLIAIIAGILTFLSPCILPLVPAYFSYMAGAAAQEARR